MKRPIKMSYDIKEWNRYHFTTMVDDALSIEEQRQVVLANLDAGDFEITRCQTLDGTESDTTEYNFPDELGGPTESTT